MKNITMDYGVIDVESIRSGVNHLHVEEFDYSEYKDNIEDDDSIDVGIYICKNISICKDGDGTILVEAQTEDNRNISIAGNFILEVTSI